MGGYCLEHNAVCPVELMKAPSAEQPKPKCLNDPVYQEWR